MDIYARNILDHYQRPRNRGPLVDADSQHQQLNRSCGDEIKVYVKAKDGILLAVSFEGRGCAISTAAISIMSEMLPGKSVAEVMAMGIEELKPLLGIEISPRRQRCALLGLQALQGALTRLGERQTESKVISNEKV